MIIHFSRSLIEFWHCSVPLKDPTFTNLQVEPNNSLKTLKHTPHKIRSDFKQLKAKKLFVLARLLTCLKYLKMELRGFSTNISGKLFIAGLLCRQSKENPPHTSRYWKNAKTFPRNSSFIRNFLISKTLIVLPMNDKSRFKNPIKYNRRRRKKKKEKRQERSARRENTTGTNMALFLSPTQKEKSREYENREGAGGERGWRNQRKEQHFEPLYDLWRLFS